MEILTRVALYSAQHRDLCQRAVQVDALPEHWRARSQQQIEPR
jgi:hypothetical protein